MTPFHLLCTALVVSLSDGFDTGAIGATSDIDTRAGTNPIDQSLESTSAAAVKTDPSPADNGKCNETSIDTLMELDLNISQELLVSSSDGLKVTGTSESDEDVQGLEEAEDFDDEDVEATEDLNGYDDEQDDEDEDEEDVNEEDEEDEDQLKYDMGYDMGIDGEIEGLSAEEVEEEWGYEEDEEEEDYDDEDEEDNEADEYYYLEEEQEGPGADFGLVQIVDPEEVVGSDADKFNQTAVEENLVETAKYMTEVVMKDDFYIKVRDLCHNYHPLCAAWAAHGECIENSDYMDEICAPACKRCEQLHYETRCPHDDSMPNILQPGDLNNIFERIAADDNLKTQVLSSPESTTNMAPWIIAIDDFLSAEEAEFMINMGSKLGFEKNTVSGGMDEDTGEAEDNIEDEAITSSSVWCTGDCDSEEITEDIFSRIAAMTGIPIDYTEHLQLVKCKSVRYGKFELPKFEPPLILSF